MSNGQFLAEGDLLDLVQTQEIDGLEFSQLEGLFRSEKNPEIRGPGGLSAFDPRDATPVLFNPGRARRPEDYSSSRKAAESSVPCAICSGRTTGIIDHRKLSGGYTFVNKNLFPIVFPDEPQTYGFHLLQWTSNHHDRDWHNMPVGDCTVVMHRMAALERYFVTLNDAEWYVSIIKNHGALVGGSLAHGHQQILAGHQKPRSVLQHEQFRSVHGTVFSEYLLNKLTTEQVVKDYGSGVLAVPYYMKRPYDMVFLIRDTKKSYLHELDEDELAACAEAWHDALSVYHRLFPDIGRQLAFNVIVHNGPGAGIYVEFLPYTQEIGGFEHLGLYCSQGSPDETARIIREYL